MFIKYFQSNNIKDKDTGGAFSTCSRKLDTTFSSENLNGRRHFVDLRVDGKHILNLTVCEGAE
jgi:hypothetical protein